MKLNQLWDHLQNVEPARAYLFVRVVAYLILGATGSAIAPEQMEVILASLAMLLGVDAATTEATRRKVTSPRTAAEMMAQLFVGEVGGHIRGLVEKALPESKWGPGLQAVVPILTEYAGQQLTPERRAEIQAKVDAALLQAGLVKARTWGPKAAGLLFLLVIVPLSGCAIFQPVAQDVGGEAVDYVLGDIATLTATPEGTVFDPVEGEADGVVVNLVGAAILGEDPRCSPTEVPEGLEGLSCFLGDDVTDPTLVTVGATMGYASATYTRPGSSRPYRISLD